MFGIFNGLLEIHRNNIEALSRSGMLAAAGAQTLAQEYAAASRHALEDIAAAARALAACRSPVESLALQLRLGREAFSIALAERNRLAELTVEAIRGSLAPLGLRAREIAAAIPGPIRP
ncbi:MAG: phasin family protein [Alphaproteobacteria bacterium]|nr:phasin family protein [Alphaproteobacteria bacterium]